MTQSSNKGEVFIRSVISEHKKFPHGKRPAPGYKRVMAIVSASKNSRRTVTRHVDTRDGEMGMLGGLSFV